MNFGPTGPTGTLLNWADGDVVEFVDLFLVYAWAGEPEFDKAILSYVRGGPLKDPRGTFDVVDLFEPPQVAAPLRTSLKLENV